MAESQPLETQRRAQAHTDQTGNPAERSPSRVGASFPCGSLDARALTPQMILALQRTAGNAAVNRLLAASPRQSSARSAFISPPTRELVAQRQPQVAGEAEPTPNAAGAPPYKESAASDSAVTLSDLSVTFPMDADGDGESETKRLFFRGAGEDAELMLNPDPLLFQAFLRKDPRLAQDPTITGLVKSIRALLGLTLTVVVGQQIGQQLRQLATYLGQTFQVARPPSVATWVPKTIQHGSIREVVTDSLVVEPLSAQPGANFTGSGVQQSSTPLMDALHNWSAGYVRGHMLNAKLHGPGEHRNLVPISSGTNSAMAHGIEAYLKTKVLDKNAVVAYEITPQNWGGFAGTGSLANNVETILPANFRIKVTPMRLAHVGDDGTNPANWVRKAGKEQDHSLVHAAPKTIRYNKNAAPLELRPGIYRLERGTWFPNNAQAGVWVVQNSLRKTEYSGGNEVKIKIDEPTNVAAAPFNGHPALLEEIDQQLIVTSAAAALDELQRRQVATDHQMHLLTQQQTKTALLFNTARGYEQEIEQRLAAYQQQGQGWGADLQAKGIRTDFFEQRYGSFCAERQNVKNTRDAMLNRAGLAVPDHQLRLAACIQERTTFWTAQKTLLNTNQAGFWAAQPARSLAAAKFSAGYSDLGQEVRSLNQELERLAGQQLYERDRIQRELDQERARYEQDIAKWQQEQARHQATAPRVPTAYPKFELDIDLSGLMREMEANPLKPPGLGRRTGSHLVLGADGSGAARRHTPRHGPYNQVDGPRDKLLTYARDLISNRRTRVEEQGVQRFSARANEYLDSLHSDLPFRISKEEFSDWKGRIKSTIDELAFG